MAKDFEPMEDSNRSANPYIHDVSDPSRRVVLLGGMGALTVGALAPWLAGCAAAAPAAGGGPLIGFKRVPVSEKDTVVVPEGYEAVAFAAVGRAGRRAGQHAGVPLGREQQRRRPGGADGHAPRRHPLLSRSTAAARTACWS